MVEWLVNHEDMDYEEAADFISYNSSYYYGENYPVIYYEPFEEDIDEEDYEPLVFTRLEDLLELN